MAHKNQVVPSFRRYKWIGVVVFAVLLYLWVQNLFGEIYNLHCHVDVEQWKEATANVYDRKYEAAAERDRPILTLALATIWMNYGFPALDALLLNTRIAWVACIAACLVWSIQRFNIRAAIFSLVFMLWSHSYSALVVSVAAQIPFNALVAVHLCFGYSLARSSKWWSWIALGGLSCLLPLCKEQGFFFPFLSLFFLLYSAPKRFLSRGARFLFFSIGAAPFLGVLYWWQTLIWNHGRKYQELVSDLTLLYGEESFLAKTQALLKWGTIETTFQFPTGYWDLMYKAWIRLTNEIGVHLLIGLALVILALIVSRFTDRKRDDSTLLWTLLHILPAIPLFALLLIEPYHLSFLEVPAVGLLAWSTFYLLPDASPFSREGWPSSWMSWHTLGSLGLSIGLAVTFVRGQPFFWAMPWEIGGCLMERLIPVLQYTKQNPSLQKNTMYITDNSMDFSTTLPDNWKKSPSAKDLHLQRCEKDFALVTSKKTSGYVFISELLHPNQWRKIQEVPSINDERWLIYTGKCR